jgi:hypothetical protein
MILILHKTKTCLEVYIILRTNQLMGYNTVYAAIPCEYFRSPGLL